MISRKIKYNGSFNSDSISEIYKITRQTEITGEVKKLSDKEVELNLEGDPSVIKLIQHQIDRKLKNQIKEKQISPIPFQNFQGIKFLS